MADEFQLESYLTRIAYRGPLAPDLATLNALQAAHVDALPFEALDPLMGRPVHVDLASVQQKLVHGRRGGYCFEQNVLFQAALEAIGFKVTGLTGRVRWRSQPTDPLGPRQHMMLLVEVEGRPHLVDVGFGICMMDGPVRLEVGLEQSTPMGTFRIGTWDGLYTISAKQPTGWRMMYAFDLAPQIHADYVLGSWYTSTNATVPATHTLMVERVEPTVRHKLVSRRYQRQVRDGEVIEERIVASAAELGRLIEDVFRVTPPVPIGAIWARTAD
ncbi:Putative N-hydroxyarylamine O-acetyltransferase [Bradyrhizobium sp. ORS 285]|uniref:arylamine N-acetyltransferase family protein n=1 Tax=Bradyrhizobium sp. ORS 285 TaxID=115808 RepID=UPI00024056CA|nr:arylamine N-acetyltransferase [Bradyrhizobium sp. ORS 285]CCD87721.1 putative N-hydroxyarylamine O-acetyltransferase [Bradyrhizobium sp. ORS 285]SMX60938.1 Putative N-hydroxyarylamine O-acetyltransferase [Bradyrhizobium sp. ORS 285]